MTSNAINPHNNPTYTFRFAIPNFDPKMMDFLPPELLKNLEQDLKVGTVGQSEEQPTDIKKKIKFDYKMVNCNQDLKVLTTKLKQSKRLDYGLLLWGVSGSGKSFYAEWLAQELGLGFIKKRASDLIDKWVGATEKNIADAFREAKEKKAVLVFDEADSFLFDRKFATREHEAASVNEVLTQMENHPYPFVMTTNLKDKIDRAALRRFIFKIKYDYMKAEQIKAGIKNYFGKEFKLNNEQLSQLTHLCAGDFKVVKHKMDILDNGEYTTNLIFEYLLKEQEEKEIEKGSNPIQM